MNDNSSRFGKYIQLKFDATGAVLGAKISEYLLEKSRVVGQAPGEQNYHIFYYLFAGLDEERRKQLGLAKPSKHRFLSSSGHPSDERVMSVANRNSYEEVITMLLHMGFSAEETEEMVETLAAILILGDLEFSGSEDSSKVVSSAATIAKVAEVLGVPEEDLVGALTTSCNEMRGEVIVRNLSVDAASDSRDALCKSCYSRMFSWVVSSCNGFLVDTEAVMDARFSLGVLDIFGFEHFKVNRLEQLLINITNEQLQFYFNERIFRMEQEEYQREGVEVAVIDYENNGPTLDCLLGKSGSLLSMVDEECKMPRATDQTLTAKLHKLESHPSSCVSVAKSEKALEFKVAHYAGSVGYSSDGFLEKNRDKVSSDLTRLVKMSSVPLISSLFRANRRATGSFAVHTARGRKKKAAASASASNTLCGFFVESLNELMARLNQATPYFVRCIKPNREKVAGKFSKDHVITQLQYSGVLETVRIRKVGAGRITRVGPALPLLPHPRPEPGVPAYVGAHSVTRPSHACNPLGTLCRGSLDTRLAQRLPSLRSDTNTWGSTWDPSQSPPVPRVRQFWKKSVFKIMQWATKRCS